MTLTALSSAASMASSMEDGVIAAAAAAAVAAGAIMAAAKNQSSEIPHHISGSPGSGHHSKGEHGATAGPPVDDEGSSCEESEAEDYDECIEIEDDAVPRASKESTGKLWTKEQFPEGTDGAANFEMANLIAAQEYSCPCNDRHNCIGSERLSILQLYNYRKTFRETAAQQGGLRDASRKDLEAHFDRQTKSFTRSFVVGPLGDCCEASAGLAKGISFATFANSRADTTKEKPWHAGRCQLRKKVESEERARLQALAPFVSCSVMAPPVTRRAHSMRHLSGAELGTDTVHNDTRFGTPSDRQEGNGPGSTGGRAQRPTPWKRCASALTRDEPCGVLCEATRPSEGPLLPGDLLACATSAVVADARTRLQ